MSGSMAVLTCYLVLAYGRSRKVTVCLGRRRYRSANPRHLRADLISLSLGEPLRARVRGSEVGPDVWKHGSAYCSPISSMREVQEGHSMPWETPVGSQTHATLRADL
jgi:hypothetical protein